MGKAIHFYQVNRPYGYFSNFSAHPIQVGGKVWPTSEHYFQAMKFKGTPREEAIRAAPTPAEAARIGRDRSLPLRKDWESVKDDVMRAALEAKFTQHQELRAHLLNTGSAEIVEHTENDAYWADGGNGKGKNMLGVLLMELRAKLRGCA